MAFQDWFSRRSPLQLAFERGTQPGADLSDELRKLGDYTVKSQADAEAICNLVARLAFGETAIGGTSALESVIGLFRDVKGVECPAFSVLAEKGIPLLISIVDDALANPSRHDPEAVLCALKMLAIYGTAEGTDAVLRAARQPLERSRLVEGA
jgi:hypothetical protein